MCGGITELGIPLRLQKVLEPQECMSGRGCWVLRSEAGEIWHLDLLEGTDETSPLEPLFSLMKPGLGGAL